VLRKSLTLKGYLNGEIVNDDATLDRAKSFITKGLASGQLKPLIARVFRLDQIQEATRFLESSAQVGKIVVNV
jgi:NADPH:quinone reductase-like Zn-dependent oxidoreductase